MYWNVFKVQLQRLVLFLLSVFCLSIFFLFFSFPGIWWFLNRYLLTQKRSKKNILYEQMTCTFTTAQREVSHTIHLQHGNMAASLKVMTSSLLPPSVFFSPPQCFSHLSLYFHRNSTVLNSKVISVAIKPTPSSLSTPLEIEFSHLYNVSQSAL